LGVKRIYAPTLVVMLHSLSIVIEDSLQQSMTVVLDVERRWLSSSRAIRGRSSPVFSFLLTPWWSSPKFCSIWTGFEVGNSFLHILSYFYSIFIYLFLFSYIILLLFFYFYLAILCDLYLSFLSYFYLIILTYFYSTILSYFHLQFVSLVIYFRSLVKQIVNEKTNSLDILDPEFWRQYCSC